MKELDDFAKYRLCFMTVEIGAKTYFALESGIYYEVGAFAKTMKEIGFEAEPIFLIIDRRPYVVFFSSIRNGIGNQVFADGYLEGVDGSIWDNCQIRIIE